MGYSMILSARPRRESGTLIPMALAALRFTMSSTVVDCCTGRSASLAPLLHLPTRPLTEGLCPAAIAWACRKLRAPDPRGSITCEFPAASAALGRALPDAGPRLGCRLTADGPAADWAGAST